MPIPKRTTLIFSTGSVCFLLLVFFATKGAFTENHLHITDFTFTPTEIAPGDSFTATFSVTGGEIERARLSVDTRPHGVLLFPVLANFDAQTHTLTGTFSAVGISDGLEGKSVKVTLRVYDSQGRYTFVTQPITLNSNHPPTIDFVELMDGETFTAGESVLLQIVATEPTQTPLVYQFTDSETVLQSWTPQSMFIWQTTGNHVGLHTLTYAVRNKFQKVTNRTATVYGFRAPIPPSGD
jgi:hypothetical protein